jgi:RNA polymerase sigma-70 factor (ECF subfamily)
VTELESPSPRATALTCPVPSPADSALTSPLDRAMSRYAEGDDGAFSEVYQGLTPRLRAFLRRLGCSQDLADDLSQETLLRMHRARGSFAQDRSVVPWAYAIARNCYMSHARSSKVRMTRNAVDASSVEVAAGPGVCAESTSIARQTARVVEQALASMTDVRREAFVLLRYEGMSVVAAAQVVGVSEGALKVRAFHAYETIRAALRAMEEGPASVAKR